MTYILTIVLFIANVDPIGIIGVYSDRPSCGAQESAILTQAMSEQKVIGYQLIEDCKLVTAVNKV